MKGKEERYLHLIKMDNYFRPFLLSLTTFCPLSLWKIQYSFPLKISNLSSTKLASLFSPLFSPPLHLTYEIRFEIHSEGELNNAARDYKRKFYSNPATQIEIWHFSAKKIVYYSSLLSKSSLCFLSRFFVWSKLPTSLNFPSVCVFGCFLKQSHSFFTTPFMCSLRTQTVALSQCLLIKVE